MTGGESPSRGYDHIPTFRKEGGKLSPSLDGPLCRETDNPKHTSHSLSSSAPSAAAAVATVRPESSTARILVPHRLFAV